MAEKTVVQSDVWGESGNHSCQVKSICRYGRTHETGITTDTDSWAQHTFLTQHALHMTSWTNKRDSVFLSFQARHLVHSVARLHLLLAKRKLLLGNEIGNLIVTLLL